MNWFDITSNAHARTFPHDAKLSSLPSEWERELAALWRLEADVNNGAYLQFLSNWGRESYVYALQALKKIGAHKMADIIERCQALVDAHLDPTTEVDYRDNLVPNQVIGHDGRVKKRAGSVLPKRVIAQIDDLSCQFMDYPDNIASLGLAYYSTLIAKAGDAGTQ